MNKLELAQEINDKIKDIHSKTDELNLGDVEGFYVCVHNHYKRGLMFSVWAYGFDSDLAPTFDTDLNLRTDNGYKGDIDEARAALKEFLEGEV